MYGRIWNEEHIVGRERQEGCQRKKSVSWSRVRGDEGEDSDVDDGSGGSGDGDGGGSAKNE